MVNERIARTPENIKTAEIITAVFPATVFALAVNVIDAQIERRSVQSATTYRQLTPKDLKDGYSAGSRVLILYRTLEDRRAVVELKVNQTASSASPAPTCSVSFPLEE